MVRIEKGMGRLIGTPCFQGYAAIPKNKNAGRWSKKEWPAVLPEFRRSHYLHACTPKVTLEEAKLILYRWTV